MKTALRTLALSLAISATAMVALAQPLYTLIVEGTVTGCANLQQVNIASTPGSVPSYNCTLQVAPNTCFYDTILYFNSPVAGVVVNTMCGGTVLGATETASFNGVIDTATVVLNFNCTAQTMDCLGVPGGSAVAGSPCDDGNPQTFYDMYMPNCVCTGVPQGDCFTWVDWYQAQDAGSPVPFEVEYSAATAGAQPITYSWYFGDVTIGLPFVLEGTSTVPNWNRTFNGGESLAFMVLAVDANGCESTWTNAEAIMPCDGILGSFAQPGFPCTTVLGLPGTWSTACACVANPQNCAACFTFNSPAPFVVDFSNCSVLPSGENAMLWTFPDGSTYEPPPPGLFNSPSYTFASAGVYPFCFTIFDFGPVTGCSFCDTLYVDAQGNVTTSNTPVCSPCVQLVQSTNGPAGPPIPWALEAMNCSSGGVQPVQYSYSWSTGESTQSITAAMEGEYFVCIYMLDANGCQATTCDSVYVDANGNVGIEPQPCQAGFWVFQAYEVDSLNPNGGAVPIPFELWVWNLSTGTSPFNFEWDFGDGASSFDPYPTHVYGASGPYNLCLTIDDASGCSSIYCDSVSIDGDGFYEGMAPESEVRNGFTIRVLNQLPTSVEEQAYNEPRLWPNPVTDALSLSFRSTVSGIVPVSIIDPDGRSVRQERLAFNRGANSISLNASDLAAGIYLLRIGDDANTMNIRFIKH